MADAGCQCVYVVDSAGALVLEDVTYRVQALRAELGDDAQIGFHGHENLDIAVANSVNAVRAGAQQIDGSIRRFGAGAGNTPTEAFVGVCDKLGITTGIDFMKIADAAQDVVRPAMPSECLVDRSAMMMGYAGCYPASSSTPRITPNATASRPRRSCWRPVPASSSAARRTSSSTSRWNCARSRTPTPASDVRGPNLCRRITLRHRCNITPAVEDSQRHQGEQDDQRHHAYGERGVGAHPADIAGMSIEFGGDEAVEHARAGSAMTWTVRTEAMAKMMPSTIKPVQKTMSCNHIAAAMRTISAPQNSSGTAGRWVCSSRNTTSAGDAPERLPCRDRSRPAVRLHLPRPTRPG